MPDLSPDQLAKIQADRAKIFSARWFADLLAGRLGFGDTFWLGNYGILLFVVPVVVLVSGLLYAQAPDALMPVLRAVAGALGLWRLAVLRALVIARGRGVWVAIGLIWTLGEALAALWTALTLA